MRLMRLYLTSQGIQKHLAPFNLASLCLSNNTRGASNPNFPKTPLAPNVIVCANLSLGRTWIFVGAILATHFHQLGKPMLTNNINLKWYLHRNMEILFSSYIYTNVSQASIKVLTSTTYNIFKLNTILTSASTWSVASIDTTLKLYFLLCISTQMCPKLPSRFFHLPITILSN